MRNSPLEIRAKFSNCGARRGFYRHLRRRLELNSLHSAHWDTTALELQLDAAAQFARYIVLPRGRGAYLQAHGRGILVKNLQAQNARPVDNGLRPRGVRAQFRGGGIESLQRRLLGNLRRK